ncbi:hypothetical protein DMUE_1325 [Dictyocoela muelleri]|nr:hypothetical protein DMUE_1325 [Dictyocoela muelleri]
MIRTIELRLKISGVREIIKRICTNCKIFISENTFRSNYRIPIYKNTTNQTDDILDLDIKGPIESKHFKIKNTKNHFYLLVCTDIFMRFTETEIIFDNHSSTVCKKLEQMWINKYKPPKKNTYR